MKSSVFISILFLASTVMIILTLSKFFMSMNSFPGIFGLVSSAVLIGGGCLVKKKSTFFLVVSVLTLALNISLPLLETWVETENTKKLEALSKESLDFGPMHIEPYWVIRGDSTSLPHAGEFFTSRYTVLNFWAPWCPPCIKEMPLLDQFYEEFSDSDVTIIGITGSYRSKDDENPDKYLQWVETTMDKTNISYPVIFDIDSKNAIKYKARSLPLTVLLDDRSRIIEYRIGIKGAKVVMDRIRNSIEPNKK